MAKNEILTSTEIASFCRQTSMLYKSGITPAEGMQILMTDTLSEDGRNLLQSISDTCRQGNYFHTALEKTGVFPDYVVKLISLGEESGDLDDVLDSLAEYYEREDDVSESIRSAIMYPMIMIAMMVLIIIVLISKVLPIFKQVFNQLGTEMSPFAEKLMNWGTSLSRYAVGIIIVLLVFVIAVIILFRVPKIKKSIKKFLARFPLTRDFYYNIAAGRFASGMHLSFSSGMDTFHSLDMISELVENDKMQEKIKVVRSEIENRATMPEALSKAEVFSNLYTRMIAVGFTSGSVDSIMKQIAIHYEEATDKQLRRLISIIEPTLVIFLSLVVGIILLSVLLPLMGIMSSIG